MSSPVELALRRLTRLVPKEYADRLLATRGQPRDERRTVTILFCDVKGSTAIAEKLDPEEVKEILDGVFEFLITPVYRYEGTLAQLMGDAILAFFGAPIAHEDDAERACRAGLEIVTGAQEYAKRLEVERRIAGFNVRVGINTGLVVVGEVGTNLRVAYTAVGDAINLAARMEQCAEPGTVLIAPSTHRLVAPLFDVQKVGPLQLRGKSEPTVAYRVLAARQVHNKARGIVGLDSPLVGRERELRALSVAVDRLRRGTGGLVMVIGEAGLGKSRLVAEVRNDALAAAGPVRLLWVEGRCLSYGTAVAFQLWRDVLRGLLGVTQHDGPEAVRRILQKSVARLCPQGMAEVYPYVARMLSLREEDEPAVKPDDLEGQRPQTRTFRAVERLLESAALEQPLVIVNEDLHWADATSLQLLERLRPWFSGSLCC